MECIEWLNKRHSRRIFQLAEAENGQINPLRIMVILFILLFVLLFVIALYILSSVQEIYITRDGLFFPPLMSPSLSIKTKHAWSDLTGLSFAKTNYGCENLALTFNRFRESAQLFSLRQHVYCLPGIKK